MQNSHIPDQQHVKFESLTVTNPNGNGVELYGRGTNVEVLKCCVKMCKCDGVYMVDGAVLTATQCEFTGNGGDGVCCGVEHIEHTQVTLNDCTIHHNGKDGVNASAHAVVDLHGAKTNIHSNKECGIYATDDAKVNIHLSSEHNTAHDNRNGNRFQTDGGSIANMNADGTFTHVVAREDFMPDLVFSVPVQ